MFAQIGDEGPQPRRRRRIGPGHVDRRVEPVVHIISRDWCAADRRCPARTDRRGRGRSDSRARTAARGSGCADRRPGRRRCALRSRELSVCSPVSLQSGSWPSNSCRPWSTAKAGLARKSWSMIACEEGGQVWRAGARRREGCATASRAGRAGSRKGQGGRRGREEGSSESRAIIASQSSACPAHRARLCTENLRHMPAQDCSNRGREHEVAAEARADRASASARLKPPALRPKRRGMSDRLALRRSRISASTGWRGSPRRSPRPCMVIVIGWQVYDIARADDEHEGGRASARHDRPRPVRARCSR